MCWKLGKVIDALVIVNFLVIGTCHIAYTVDRSEEDTTPDPVITTEPVTTTRIITTPVLTTEPVTTEQIITNPVITTEPGTITKSQTVVSTSESSSTNMCPDDCPTPRIGCTLIKANEDDCCGKESCFGEVFCLYCSQYMCLIVFFKYLLVVNP